MPSKEQASHLCPYTSIAAGDLGTPHILFALLRRRDARPYNNSTSPTLHGPPSKDPYLSATRASWTVDAGLPEQLKTHVSMPAPHAWNFDIPHTPAARALLRFLGAAGDWGIRKGGTGVRLVMPGAGGLRGTRSEGGGGGRLGRWRVS